ncbi:MAG TPA: hypothetical protein VFY84_21385 [Jiangellales bacterium]|nr:hypothetical protein [Jiangellales bacterium]
MIRRRAGAAYPTEIRGQLAAQDVDPARVAVIKDVVGHRPYGLVVRPAPGGPREHAEIGHARPQRQRPRP